MSHKGEKKLCWNCDGYVGVQLRSCPYCGVDLGRGQEDGVSGQAFFASPWDNEDKDPSVSHTKKSLFSHDFPVSDQEWNEALQEDNKDDEKQEETTPPLRREMIALLLLLPGVVFCLFALILLFFSQDGELTLKWKQSFVYFYLFGSLPLLYLGWRALR